MPVPSATFDSVATAIGRSCYWWSNIEYTLQELCVNLARFGGEGLRNEAVWPVLETMLSHMDVRQRIEVAKVLAAQNIDPDLYETIAKLLNVVGGDLRNERNRFVHDQWEVDDESIVRRKHGAHVYRPQSRTVAVRQNVERRYADAAEVGDFADRVALALDELIAVQSELDDLHDEIWPQ